MASSQCGLERTCLTVEGSTWEKISLYLEWRVLARVNTGCVLNYWTRGREEKGIIGNSDSIDELMVTPYGGVGIDDPVEVEVERH